MHIDNATPRRVRVHLVDMIAPDARVVPVRLIADAGLTTRRLR
jgi:hypothetical protein